MRCQEELVSNFLIQYFFLVIKNMLITETLENTQKYKEENKKILQSGDNHY